MWFKSTGRRFFNMECTMPPIPVQAEPFHELQARYPRCLEYIYDSEQIALAGAIRPGEVQANVFDFADGLRLIIGRQRVRKLDEMMQETGEYEVILHVSASLAKDSGLYKKIERDARRMPVLKAIRKWLDTIPLRFEQLSGNKEPLEFLGFDGCVGHWMQEEK